jgi:uncharacterized protein
MSKKDDATQPKAAPSQGPEEAKQERTTLVDFPCDFPVKVMGRTEGPFLKDAQALFYRHYPELTASAFSERPSKAKHFTALTVTVHALNQAELDALYRDITACDSILMAF